MFDLAIDLALDARKLRFNLYFALECERHCRLPSCEEWHADFSARRAAAEIVLGDRSRLSSRTTFATVCWCSLYLRAYPRIYIGLK